MTTRPQPAPDFLYMPSRAARVAATEFTRRRDAPGRITWGVKAMDDYLVPELPGELISLIGRPGMAKTSALLAKARNAAASWVKDSGGCVLYATWETLIEEAVGVLAAPASGFTLEDIGRGALEEGQMQAVVDAATGLLDSGIVFFGRSLESPPGRIPTLDDLEAAMLDLYDRGMPAKLLIVDYLQRIPYSARGRSDNEMNTRVSANLDRCKDLAIQLKVPCDIAVQARREVDDYTKLKIPTMKDGQWSCLTGDTLVVDAGIGEIRTLREWCELGGVMELHELDRATWQFFSSMCQIKESGKQEVFDIACSSGYSIRASANHPFLTYDGWKRLDELHVGDMVAVARSLPTRIQLAEVPTEVYEITGLMIGDGSHLNGRTPSLAVGHNAELAKNVQEKVLRQFGFTPRLLPNASAGSDYLVMSSGDEKARSNPITNWLRSCGVYGQDHNHIRLPHMLTIVGDEQLAGLLRGLYTADGSFSKANHPFHPVVSYSTTSEMLARQIKLCLLRFGIRSGLCCQKPKLGGRRTLPLYVVNISGMDNVDKFMENIAFLEGEKQNVALQRWESSKAAREKTSTSADLFPREVAKEALEVVRHNHKRAEFNLVPGRMISRERLLRLAYEVMDPNLANLADGDAGWVVVDKITSAGSEMTYDVTAPPLDNFVANGFIVHNSTVEQTSDKVLGITRPILYMPEGTEIRREGFRYTVGERTLVVKVLKQRWGPSGDKVFVLDFDPRTCSISPQEAEGEETEGDAF